MFLLNNYPLGVYRISRFGIFLIRACFPSSSRSKISIRWKTQSYDDAWKQNFRKKSPG